MKNSVEPPYPRGHKSRQERQGNHLVGNNIALTDRNVGWAERLYREAQQTQNINTGVLKEDWVCWASYLSPTYMLWIVSSNKELP